MAVGSDVDILRGIRNDWIRISPYNSSLLNPASYDVTLGDEILVYESVATPTTDQTPKHVNLHQEGGYLLCPGEFVLGSTEQLVGLDSSVSAQVAGKSSLARQGLNIHTAGWIDPGFVGQVTLELSTTVAFRLKAGMRIGQLVFLSMMSPCASAYGVAGHYQYQRGPTAARTGTEGV